LTLLLLAAQGGKSGEWAIGIERNLALFARRRTTLWPLGLFRTLTLLGTWPGLRWPRIGRTRRNRWSRFALRTTLATLGARPVWATTTFGLALATFRTRLATLAF
jgi:hypothetical protein